MKYVIDMDEEEHNRIRHFCSFGDNNIPLGWFEIAKSKPLQTELEEIKAEIENEYPLKMPTHSRAQGKSVGYGLHIALDIVNKRISELKGENNGNS